MAHKSMATDAYRGMSGAQKKVTRENPLSTLKRDINHARAGGRYRKNSGYSVQTLKHGTEVKHK